MTTPAAISYFCSQLNLSFVLFGRASFLLLFSLCGLEPVHDGGLFAPFGSFDLWGLVLLRTVVDDPINHAVAGRLYGNVLLERKIQTVFTGSPLKGLDMRRTSVMKLLLR